MQQREIPNPYPDQRCFYCGGANPAGLKLHFYWDEATEKVFTAFDPFPWMAGQGKILHGGFQMGLLDEIMAWTSYYCTKEMAVTSDINVKFLKPVYIDEKITAGCGMAFREGPRVHLRAELRNAKGEVCTTAAGIFHILSEERYQIIVEG